jgi:hypothetical protein
MTSEESCEEEPRKEVALRGKFDGYEGMPVCNVEPDMWEGGRPMAECCPLDRPVKSIRGLDLNGSFGARRVWS